ncbi:MAG: radical SAM protein [Sphaerochaeta sp.]|nr:radical SAM protein [Sphaerochaeta sp.]
MDDVARYYDCCTLCPRECRTNRQDGEYGVCGELAHMRIASVGLHHGEEPILVQSSGSGTIFFTGCSLHCPACQNQDISQARSPHGVVVTVEQLAAIALDLERQGAININVVTPTHFAPSIAAAITLAKEHGLSIPLVYNTSGYESVESLALVDPLVDLYLLDIKTVDSEVARLWCGSREYPEVIMRVVRWLAERRLVTEIDENGALTGTLVRHLIFPGTFSATMQFLHWYANTFASHSWLSLLTHFWDPTDGRRSFVLSASQYAQLIALLKELGITRGYLSDPYGASRWIGDLV